MLIGGDQYAGEIVPLMENAYRENLYLSVGDFHPLVEDELAKFRSRFKDNFLKMKARLRGSNSTELLVEDKQDRDIVVCATEHP